MNLFCSVVSELQSLLQEGSDLIIEPHREIQWVDGVKLHLNLVSLCSHGQDYLVIY